MSSIDSENKRSYSTLDLFYFVQNSSLNVKKSSKNMPMNYGLVQFCWSLKKVIQNYSTDWMFIVSPF